MSAIYLFRTPSFHDAVPHLLHRFAEAARTKPGSALWLGPSHRGVEAVRQRLPGSVVGSHLLTFQDFVEEVIRTNDPDARPLSHVQRRLLVEAVVADLYAAGELRHFGRVIETRGFASAVFALIVELKRHEIWRSTLTPVVEQAGDAKDKECLRIYGEYQRRLRMHRLYDLEGRAWYARELLHQGKWSPWDTIRTVFVVGFSQLTRTQQQILGAFAGRVDELWVPLPGEEETVREELFRSAEAMRAQLEQRLFPPAPEEEEEYPIRRTEYSIPTGRRTRTGPAGLVHLREQLFRPVRMVEQSDDAEGVFCIEAPGLLGETRMVARHIKGLLLEGVAADDVIVSMRDVQPYADLVREVFDEYGIPTDVEGLDPLTRSGAVSTLLRAVRLPDEDWHFNGVTALLRSTYFHPDWPEAQADPSIPQHAEVLLRLIGEPRNRNAYLEAVRRWADDPPPALEDEQADESRRLRTNQLAIHCRGFLKRFFSAWDPVPQSGTIHEHVEWLEQWAKEMGFVGDDPALVRFFQEVRRWRDIDRQMHGEYAISRRAFLQRLGVLASEAGTPRSVRGPGRVRVLSAELARDLEVGHLFVMGLGERSFPRLAPPEPFFDEDDRLRFQQAGIDLPSVGDLLPGERLLFFQLLSSARQRLVLSYPAVDERGQELLPSSFLTVVRECFEEGAIPTERRNMLIEGYDRDAPLSGAEYRVRVARDMTASVKRPRAMEPDLVANLLAARDMYYLRLRENEYNPYDGLFRHPDIVTAVNQLFTPERVFSPTALEDYIACPFKFFMKHVLRLDELEEPSEEIEVTRRGMAFHRALSRLHTELQKAEMHEPCEEAQEQLLEHLHTAVHEYVERAASPASRTLWTIEGMRLARVGARYAEHWKKFVEPWREVKAPPRPHFFEVDFGLPNGDGLVQTDPLVISHDGVEVRISGRIDRVDIAELEDGEGFWIIDYKTGRSSHYTSPDLRAFRKVQLTLYAVAVQDVLLKNKNARPLGLAYWLVTDTGPKVVLPASDKLAWFKEGDRWDEVRTQLEQWVTTLAKNIRSGAFPLRPRSEYCTDTCPFGQVCRIAQSRSVEKTWQLPLPLES